MIYNIACNNHEPSTNFDWGFLSIIYRDITDALINYIYQIEE